MAIATTAPVRVVPPNKFGDQLKPGEGIAPLKRAKRDCSNCRQPGHNARTCTNPKAAPPKLADVPPTVKAGNGWKHRHAAKPVQKPASAKPAPPRTSTSAGLSAELDVYADRMEENASVLRRAAAILRERP